MTEEPIVVTFRSRLQGRLTALLAGVQQHLRADVEVALAANGRLLSAPTAGSASSKGDQPAGVRPLLTMLMASYLSPQADLQAACDAALCLECQLCAFDLLDDVEDGDRTATLQKLGVGRALNTATALLFLAQQSIQALEPPLPLDPAGEQAGRALARFRRCREALVESSLVACSGQHQDLLSEGQPVEQFALKDGLAIAAAKAGSLLRLGCLLGALCVDAPDEICDLVAELGSNLGVAHQLDNDARDLAEELGMAITSQALTTTTPLSIKTDYARGKKTLPVILAAQQKTDLQKRDLPVDRDERALLQDGIEATRRLSILYLNRARTHIEHLEAALERPLPPSLRRVIGLEA